MPFSRQTFTKTALLTTILLQTLFIKTLNPRPLSASLSSGLSASCASFSPCVIGAITGDEDSIAECGMPSFTIAKTFPVGEFADNPPASKTMCSAPAGGGCKVFFAYRVVLERCPKYLRKWPKLHFLTIKWPFLPEITLIYQEKCCFGPKWLKIPILHQFWHFVPPLNPKSNILRKPPFILPWMGRLWANRAPALARTWSSFLL